MNIKGSKILITGGAGFIGSHIAESLVQCGAEVTVFDNLSCGSLENLSSIKSNINFVKGDILDAHALAEVVKDQDIVSHQAAQLEIILATSNPSWDLRVNTEGTLNVLSSSNVPNFKIKFLDMFPVSLSDLDFDATDSDIDYLTANVTFKYTIYNITDLEDNIL